MSDRTEKRDQRKRIEEATWAPLSPASKYALEVLELNGFERVLVREVATRRVVLYGTWTTGAHALWCLTVDALGDCNCAGKVEGGG